MVSFVGISIFLSLVSSLHASLNWRAFFPKYYKGEKFRAFHSFVNVPQDHSNNNNTEKLQLYIRSFRRGNPDKLLWLVPGGPGQEGHFFEHQLSTIFEHDRFNNTWIYIADHRGVGKSSRIVSKKKAGSCLNDVATCIKASKIPIRVLTPANAAKDLKLLVELVKRENSTGKSLVIASSYGTSLVYRTMASDPNLFSGILFIDFFLPTRKALANLGTYIIENCQKSPFCKQQFPDVNETIQIISRLQSPQLNKCTMALRLRPEFSTVLTGDDLRPLVQYVIYNILIALPVHIYDQDKRNKQTSPIFHPQALVLAFLKQLETCQNIDLFNQLITELINQFKAAGTLLSLSSSTDIDASRSHMNELINVYITYSEAKSADVTFCIRENANAFTNRCILEEVARKKYDQKFKDYAYLAGKLELHTINQSRATIIGYSGKIDAQAPFDIAKQALDKINTSGTKKLLTIESLGHASLWRYTDCAPLVYASIYDPKALIDAEKCLQKADERKLIFTSCPYMPKLKLWNDMSGWKLEGDPNDELIRYADNWYLGTWAIFALTLIPGLLLMTGTLLFQIFWKRPTPETS